MVHRRVVQTLESFLNASQFPAFIYHHPVVVQYLVSDESAEGFPSFFLYFLAATLTQSLWGFRQESNLSCRLWNIINSPMKMSTDIKKVVGFAYISCPIINAFFHLARWR